MCANLQVEKSQKWDEMPIQLSQELLGSALIEPWTRLKRCVVGLRMLRLDVGWSVGLAAVANLLIGDLGLFVCCCRHCVDVAPRAVFSGCVDVRLRWREKDFSTDGRRVQCALFIKSGDMEGNQQLICFD